MDKNFIVQQYKLLNYWSWPILQQTNMVGEFLLTWNETVVFVIFIYCHT